MAQRAITIWERITYNDLKKTILDLFRYVRALNTKYSYSSVEMHIDLSSNKIKASLFEVQRAISFLHKRGRIVLLEKNDPDYEGKNPMEKRWKLASSR